MNNAVKGNTNPYFNSKYTDLNAVRETVIPILNKYDIMVLQTMVAIEGKNYIQTIYIVKIPYSYNTPHISKDKKYYKRYNFESVPMEEYEVRQLYERKSKSNLVISECRI